VILFFFVLLALTPRIEIVSANDATVTYRERLPLQVALDPTTRMYHSRRKVLFIGNSLTYFNEMPRMTQQIGAHENRPLFVDAVTQSGASLEDLWFRTDAAKRIWQEHWDYVIGDFSRLDWDDTHPNVAGSYLIASSVYATIYDKAPRDLPFDFRCLAAPNEFYDKALLEQTLNEEQARMIQRAAWRAVQRVKNP